MIDLSRLRHFVVLARAGSFVRAAEELHLSQPALSRSIQALERHYGVTLFDRGRTGVTLTAVGRQILDRAEDLLSNAESLDHTIQSASAGVSGTVRFGVSPTAAALLLPPLLRSMFARYPNVRLRAVVGSVGIFNRQLLDGDIEFFISRKDPYDAHERIQMEPIGVASARFLVRRDHPLLGGEPVPVMMLRDYPRVSATAWNESLAGLTRQDVRESIEATVEVDNFELLVNVVASTDAILVSSEHAVPGLTQLEVEIPDRGWYRSEVGFFTLRGRTLSPAAEAIGAILRNLAIHGGYTQPEP